MYSPPNTVETRHVETRTPLTEAQHEVLTFIAEHVEEHGWAPTLREMCARFEWTSTNAAADHLNALQRKGYIRRPQRGAGRGRGMARTIKVIHPVPARAREGQA
jgi:repressor LexA